MRSYIKPRFVVHLVRAALAIAAPLALIMVVLTLTGCSYANRQAGEFGGHTLFPKIVFDTNVELGNQNR